MQNVKAIRSAMVRATAATATLAVLAFAALAVATSLAAANPAIAKATGQPCTKCHSPGMAWRAGVAGLSFAGFGTFDVGR